MSYILADDAPLEAPTTWEEFHRKITKETTVTYVSENDIANLPLCVICSTEKVDCQIGTRRCKINRHPCEGHVCTCKSFPVCFTCISQLLWNKSNSVLRQQARYRAGWYLLYYHPCAATNISCSPFCKAEFCPIDVTRVVVVAKTTASPSSASGKGKKK